MAAKHVGREVTQVARLAPALPRAAAAAPLWPLAVLALGTVAAFLVAITTNWANLAHLWTQCSSSSSSAPQQLQLIPTQALRFAVLFFQTALAAARPRREEAVIVGLLAALATVTAVEGSSSSGRSRSRTCLKKNGRIIRPQDATGSMTEEEEEDRTHDEAVAVSSSSNGNGNNNKVLDNLTLVWLLYQLAAGALAWQAIIIPAFLKHEQQQQQRPGKPTTTRSHENIAIPAGVALGLLVPSTLMLLRPTSAATVLVWLFFPLWVASTRRVVLWVLNHLVLGAPQPSSPSWVNIVPYIIPILYSAVAHVLLVEDILYPSSSSTHEQEAAAGRARTRSAVLLLEIDHLAIFLAFLYWVRARTALILTTKKTLVPSTTRPVLVTLAATLLLGPGAGVCLGWLSSSSCPWMRSTPDSKHWEPELQQDRGAGGGEASVPAPSTPPSGRATGTTTTTTHASHHGAAEQQQRRARARSSPKATGHFFGGPLAD